ncbi:hypothetical protein [Anaerorhabdus sp.]|uniref:hypothetical protein n=1 Tax=Anaerorhabdus sp. TaxID=1872524 RepID=UPI002FCB436B
MIEWLVNNLLPILVGLLTGICSSYITALVQSKTAHVTHIYEYYPPSLRKFTYNRDSNFKTVLKNLSDDREKQDIRVFYIKFVQNSIDSGVQDCEIEKYETFNKSFSTKVKIVCIQNHSKFDCTLKNMESEEKISRFVGNSTIGIPGYSNVYLLIEDFDSLRYLNCSINTYELKYDLNMSDGDIRAQSKIVKSTNRWKNTKEKLNSLTNRIVKHFK